MIQAAAQLEGCVVGIVLRFVAGSALQPAESHASQHRSWPPSSEKMKSIRYINPSFRLSSSKADLAEGALPHAGGLAGFEDLCEVLPFRLLLNIYNVKK
jgi:hypothetical protein